ncbi:hypothetical protein AVEN_194449-1 [Araneus ventricosus]|uniref:Uncharacterized protein n=1 Tax=Araneus ventricosus TaxID=182803 RepID=A0A4Y2A5Y5_ARAVE|nr:hypothetical protein AVEN_194449-1 [Araneus ventricosus]
MKGAGPVYVFGKVSLWMSVLTSFVPDEVSRGSFWIIPVDTVNVQLYRYNVLCPIGHPYAGAVGDSFILQYDNAASHRVQLMENCLREETITCILANTFSELKPD